jgi:hypothetical protein
MSTATSEKTVMPDGSAAGTPRGTRGRRAAGWIALAVVLVLVGSLGAVLTSAVQWSERGAFDPESAGPGGTRALARILEEQGVDVEIVRDRAAAEAALTSGPATLLLPDSPLLSDEAFGGLVAAGADVVVAEPRSRSIRMLFDGRTDGYGDAAPTAPACDLPDATRAGAVVVGATFVAEAADATGCYPVGEGYGLLSVADDDGRITAVDGGDLFTNEHLAENGNAALAVNLLGARERLVWFVPSPADGAGGGAATLDELTPEWVSPAIVLLLAAGLAAIVWRGRRFGPLVRERLPVTVRGSETTRGRARLYAQSRDVAHAGRTLRAAASTRLARALGLPASAAPEVVADALAARTGRDRQDVRRLLAGDPPRTDRELVDLTHRLQELDTALSAALRPGKDHR